VYRPQPHRGQHPAARYPRGSACASTLRTDRSLTLSEDLTLVAVAVDTRPRIEALLEPTLRLNTSGLVTLSGPSCWTGP